MVAGDAHHSGSLSVFLGSVASSWTQKLLKLSRVSVTNSASLRLNIIK